MFSCHTLYKTLSDLCFPVSVLIRENTGHRKPVFWHILRIVFIAHYEQLPKTVKRMTKYAQSNQLFSTKIILPKNGKIMEKVLGGKEPN